MLRFRTSTGPASPLTPSNVAALAAEMMAPAHFHVGPDLELHWAPGQDERIRWEIFRGRLLDPAHIRQERTFLAWSVFEVGREPTGPLLSLKLDPATNELHVVRGLECHAWEGYDAGGNVFLSRERRKWSLELVGTLQLAEFADTDALRDELACQLFLAVIGTSRLPLTSIEAPLPAFSLGHLAYFFRPAADLTQGPTRGWQGLLGFLSRGELHPSEEAHLLQTFLLAVPNDQWTTATDELCRCWQRLGRKGPDLLGVLARMFNEVSLTPWTNLTERTLELLEAFEQRHTLSPAEVVDFLAGRLCLLGRHLTAYDLVTFHHRGANYPDALLLDALLRSYLAWCERCPHLFAGDEDSLRARLRRRALRQGWLLRRHHENHPVPDLPTSPGENSRVLPASHPRVPEEQILQPTARKRRLFADDPLTAHLGPRSAAFLRQSWIDLEHLAERRELGLALFLDRSLGSGKAPGEPDQTLLLASTAFSRSIALGRLEMLAGELFPEGGPAELGSLRELLGADGVPLSAVGSAARPGAVSLGDARLAAADFVFLRTTRSSLTALVAAFDFSSLASRPDMDFLFTELDALLVPRAGPGTGLSLYDTSGQRRLEIEVLGEGGYVSRCGQEWPRDGLRVVRFWSRSEHGWQEEVVRIDLPPHR